MNWWRRVVAMIAMAPLLAGCMTLDADIDIGQDERVGYSFHIEVAEETLAQSGLPAGSDFCAASMMGESWFPDATTVEPTTRDGYAGCRWSGTAPIGSLLGSGVASGAPRVGHPRNEFTFTWAPALSGGDLSAQIEAFDVAVTFPGEVLEHNGSSTVSGTTVRWTDATDLVNSGLFARARDAPSIWDGVRRWGLYVVGATALLGLAVLVVRFVRRPSAAPVAVPAEAAEPESLPEPADLPEPAGPEVPAPTEPERFWAPPVASARWEAPPPETWAPRPEDLAGSPSGERLPPAESRDVPEQSPWARPGQARVDVPRPFGSPSAPFAPPTQAGRSGAGSPWEPRAAE